MGFCGLMGRTTRRHAKFAVNGQNKAERAKTGPTRKADDGRDQKRPNPIKKGFKRLFQGRLEGHIEAREGFGTRKLRAEFQSRFRDREYLFKNKGYGENTIPFSIKRTRK